LLAAIRAGLSASAKRLPFECFYDALGSALFEAITLLPEYGLTRAGQRLFERHAEAMASLLPAPLDVVELGSGSGRKTRILLERLVSRGGLQYFPVDVSRGALEECLRELGSLSDVAVRPIEATHVEGLGLAAAERRPGASLLVLFLGSNIGNFDREEGRCFVGEVRRALRPGDGLLLAADLEKPEQVLLEAYDDPIGLSAAFNLNALARLNRELGADFELRRFVHRVRYVGEDRRVEMRLESLRDQEVRVKALGMVVSFRKGETLWTESSYKFARGEIARVGEASGFECAAEWTDEEWPFSQTLLFAR
jgi:dimethylhistidine N-methyltransferase